MTETGLTIRLLGTPEVVADGQPVTAFISDKARALLYYLAATGEMYTRQALATLCWADMPEAQALKNLRQALYNLQKLLPDYLDVDRQTVQMLPTAAVWVDVAALRTLLDTGTATALHDAVALYRGELLAGFSVADAPNFDLWLVGEREHLQHRVLTALRTLIDQAFAAAHEEEAIAHLYRLVKVEPWAEEEQRRLIESLARRGDYTAALHQYEALRTVLAAELDVAPMPETTALIERVRRARTLPRDHLPAPATPLIGRTKELAHLRRLLATNKGAARLITVSGPGGIGKTRLALAAAHEQRYAFLDGVWWVALAALSTVDDAVATIAQAIGLDLQGRMTAPAQLLQALRNRQLLLVLDNSEHLLEVGLVNFILELLTQAPQICLLITSRERLHLQQEQLVVLAGLSASDEATQLFIDRAQQVRFDFQPTAAELEAIRHIAHLVEGMPLALELAAALTDQFTCAAIARQLTTNLDTLATTQRDVLPRQRSIRAAFDHSWALLAPAEQQLLAGLAVFAGGFTAVAAQAVADATPALLRTLIHKSLLYFDGTQGRYTLHDLVRQYAGEKLQTDRQAQMARQAAHGHYFAHFLAERTRSLQGGARTVIAEVAAEYDNIRLLWQRACETQQIPLIRLAFLPLAHFYDGTARYVEGKALYATALAAFDLQPDASPATQPWLLAGLLIAYGNMLERLGAYAAAGEAIERALAIVQAHAHAEGITYALLLLGRIALNQGEFAQAEDWLRQGVAFCRERNDISGAARALLRLGTALADQGQWQPARACYEEALTLFTADGEDRGPIYTCVELGAWEAEQGNLAAAHAYWQRCAAQAPAPHVPHLQAEAQVRIGYYLIRFAQYDEAERLLVTTLPLLRDQAHGVTFATAINHLALLYTLRAEVTIAEPLLQQALWLAHNLGTIRQCLAVLLTHSRFALCQGQSEQAAQALALVAHHSASTRRQAEEALTLLAPLGNPGVVMASPQAHVATLVREERARQAEAVLQHLHERYTPVVA